MVGGLLGPSAAGQYRVAAGLLAAADKPADMLAKAFYPEVVRLDLSTRKPWRLMVRGAALSGAMGLLFVAIVLVAGRSFIAAVFGHGFAPAASLLLLMLFGLMVMMVSFPLKPMSYAVDRPGLPLRAQLLAMIAYLLAIVPLARLWGLNGAGAAYVFAVMLVSAQMIPPLVGEYRRRIAAPASNVA
jgi:O-antigen/teichoic acid export membrane protein